MDELSQLMAESSIHSHPPLEDLHFLELESERLRRMDPSIHPLSDMHLRDRDLREISLISDHLHDLTTYGHPVDRERTIAFSDDYRPRYGAALDLDPALGPGAWDPHMLSDLRGPHLFHETFAPYHMSEMLLPYHDLGHGHGYGSYRRLGMVNPYLDDYAMLYPPILDDPYYMQIHSVLPRALPMFSDPYFMPATMNRGGYQNGLHPQGLNMRNPFMHGIDHDFGHGAIRPLINYGLRPEMLHQKYGQSLDDLYLFELMLRLDQTLDEEQRMLRWRERLAWEELNLMERRLRWQEMNILERSRLGLGTGSYWSHQLGGQPIDPSFGYVNPMFVRGIEVMPISHEQAPIMGVLDQPHYPLSPGLVSQFPMWDAGGLGLGGRISPWLDDWSRYLRPKHLIRQENIRREYAERRGEIPPGPRLVEPGRHAGGMPLFERFL